MILYGASGHAKVIIDILEKSKEKVTLLVDKDPGIKELMGYPVVHESEFHFDGTEELIISIGDNHIRKKLAEKLGCDFGWAIHPTAILGDDVSIGKGTVVMAGTVINSSAVIGDHVIVNTCASIDHDCVVGDYAHVSPHATLCGTVNVGEGTQVGAGATVIPNINIGKWVVIGAGTVVIADVPDYAVVVGNPGKVIKQTTEGQ